MKNGTLISLILIFSFSSCIEDESEIQTTCEEPIEYGYIHNCESDTICTSDICTQYLAIWKELIMQKNNLSQNYFDSQVELCGTEINSWQQGISFSVCYKFNVCWAVAYNCDSFIIKITADESYFPMLNLPRHTYLAKEEIKIAVDYNAFNSDITRMTNSNDLEFTSMESAMNDLIEFSGVNTLDLKQIFLDGDTGNLILKASAQYENEDNLCIEGTVDLISGHKNAHDTSCIIIN